MDKNSQKSKTNAEQINEAYIMKMMSKTNSEKLYFEKEPEMEIDDVAVKVNQPQEVTQAAEDKDEKREVKESRKKKPSPADYEVLFIHPSSLLARDGRSVYIRPELHERITRIVHTIGNNQISLTDYLDNVLMHHFEMFEQNIIESYTKKQKPLF
ncbi:MAG: DUF3408 domain-containing protein [Paludibacteraceae bacterium]